MEDSTKVPSVLAAHALQGSRTLPFVAFRSVHCSLGGTWRMRKTRGDMVSGFVGWTGMDKDRLGDEMDRKY